MEVVPIVGPSPTNGKTQSRRVLSVWRLGSNVGGKADVTIVMVCGVDVRVQSSGTSGQHMVEVYARQGGGLLVSVPWLDVLAGAQSRAVGSERGHIH